jgi:NAD(P)-dependent dehydrogenase (short-subunit alcohol dehydrogenase family)
MADLVGRVAVVTGASSGIGKAIGLALEARGMKVALVSRRSKQFPFDVSDAHAVERLKAKVEAELGVPAIVINNAGIFGPIANIADTDPAEWIEAIQINTVGPYLVTRAFLAGMVSQGWGRVINVSSAASLGTPGPGNSAYATSKVALNQFTRHLAAEMVGTGVTANVIHPGDVQTEMYAGSDIGPGCGALFCATSYRLRCLQLGACVQLLRWQDIKNKAGAEGQQMAEWVANVAQVSASPTSCLQTLACAR